MENTSSTLPVPLFFALMLITWDLVPMAFKFNILLMELRDIGVKFSMINEDGTTGDGSKFTAIGCSAIKKIGLLPTLRSYLINE